MTERDEQSIEVAPRSPDAAVLFGLVLAGVFAVSILSFDVLTGLGVAAVAIGGYLLLTSWMPWQRLGLALTAVAMVGAGLGLIGLGGLLVLRQAAAVEDFTLVIPVGFVILVSPLLLLVDARRHREAWERWSVSVKRASLGDFLSGRHLPPSR
jgi:MFS family permease